MFSDVFDTAMQVAAEGDLFIGVCGPFVFGVMSGSVHFLLLSDLALESVLFLSDFEISSA